MVKLLHLLGLLAIELICTFAAQKEHKRLTDGGFEDVPADKLNTTDITAGAWNIVGPSIVFASNADTSPELQTPYGEQFVRIAPPAPGYYYNGGYVQQYITTTHPGNYPNYSVEFASLTNV